jgi:hypothetical protein
MILLDIDMLVLSSPLRCSQKIYVVGQKETMKQAVENEER